MSDKYLALLATACERLDEEWRVDVARPNAFDGDLDQVESVVHELAHWFSLGHKRKPRGTIYRSLASQFGRMNTTWGDIEEARTVAIELCALDLLGVQLSPRQRTRLIRYAAGAMSRRAPAGARLIREYVDGGKNRRELERHGRRIARLVRDAAKRVIEESA